MLEELRKKPLFLKEAYAFWGAVAVTALIAAVWLVNLSARFSETASSPSSVSGSSSAFGQFFGQLKSNITASWQQRTSPADSVSADQDDEAAALTAASSTDTPVSATAIIIATTSARTVEIATTSATRP